MSDRQPRLIPQSALDRPQRGVVEWPYQHLDYAAVTQVQGETIREMRMWRHKERRDQFHVTEAAITQSAARYLFLYEDKYGPTSLHVNISDPRSGHEIVGLRQLVGGTLSGLYEPLRSGMYDRQVSTFTNRQDAINYLGQVAQAILFDHQDAAQRELPRVDTWVGRLEQAGRDVQASTPEGKEALLAGADSIESFLARLIKESDVYQHGDKLTFFTQAMALLSNAGVPHAIERALKASRAGMTESEFVYTAVTETARVLSDFRDALDGVDRGQKMMALFQEQGVTYGYCTEMNQMFPQVYDTLTHFAEWNEPISLPGGFTRTFEREVDEETKAITIVERLERDGRPVMTVSFPLDLHVSEAAAMAEDINADFPQIGALVPVTLEDARTEDRFSTTLAALAQ